MDQWDPMKEAFDNKDFNCYKEGVGRDLTWSHQRNKGIRLYVQNIPVTLGKNGLFNMFAEYGKVLYHDLRVSENSELRGGYGFVTMENMVDAEMAVRKLHKKRLGQFTLKVSPALSEEERNRRRQLRQNEEGVSSHAHSDSTKKPNLQDRDWTESTRFIPNTQAYAESSSSVSSGVNQRRSTGGLNTYHGEGYVYRQRSIITPPKSSQASRVKMCVFCYKGDCVHTCSRCKMYYCSTECQKKDWPRHESICITIGEMHQGYRAHNIHSNANITRGNPLNIHANNDVEVFNMKKDSQMKMTDRDRYVTSYGSTTNAIETNDRRKNKEQDSYKSGHQINSDKAGISQFSSKFESSGSAHFKASHNTHLAGSQSFHSEKVSLLTNSDQGGHYQNSGKTQNNRCNPVESIVSNSETYRQNDETARATHSNFKFNKFENSRYESEETKAFSSKINSQKSLQIKAAKLKSSDQEYQFKNKVDTTKSEDGQRNKSKMWRDKTTNETRMRSPNYMSQVEESDGSPSKLKTNKKMTPGSKTIPSKAKNTLPSVLELSLTINTSDLCYLTFFESPYKFWISLKQFLEMFTENTLLMEQEISKNPLSSPIDCQVDGTYSVMFMGEWCRVKVVSISGRDITVFFLDYGNQTIVKPEDLRPLTEDMLEPPAQAVCCSLSKIKPKGSDSWSETACTAAKEWLGDPMTNFLQYEIVAKKGSVHLVNISQKNTSMREMLLSRGFGESVNYDTVLHGNNRNSVDPPRHMAHALTSIMDEKKNGDKMSVVLTDFVSTSRFIVLDTTSYNFLNEMSSLLQLEYANSTILYRPVQGELVAAKFSRNGKWYRAEVTSIDGDSCIVFFVDYGNSEEQKVENIRPLTKQNWIEFPKQALFCSLFSSQTWSDYGMDVINKEFHTLLGASLNNEGFCKLQVKDKRKDTLLVDFISSSNIYLSEILGQRLSSLSSDRQHRSPQGRSHNEQFTPKTKSLVSLLPSSESTTCVMRGNTVTKLDLEVEKLVNLNGEPVSVTVSFVKSPQEFYVQLNNKHDLFISMMKNLNSSALSSNTLLAPFDRLTAIQFSQDLIWYRGKIEKIENNKCLVHFIDYGNSEEALLSNLKVLPPSVCSLPAQAIRCHLDGSLENLARISATEFKEQLENKPAFVRVCGSCAESVSVQLLLNGKDILSTIQNVSTSPQIGLVPMLSDLIVESPSEKEVDAIFSYIKNLSDFYCQKFDTTEIKELESLSCKLRDDALKYDENFHIVPKVNGIYTSKFMGDWYRCVIEEVKMSNVLIRYIDYGNREEVPTNQLRPLNPERMHFPIRLLKCKLYGVTPAQKDWNCPRMGEYLKILQQRKVRLVIEAKEMDTLLVSLFVVHGSEKVNVTEDLVNMGIAKFLEVSPPPQVEAKLNLPYPHGFHYHHAQNAENEYEDNELEIQRKIQELQVQLKLSQQKKKQNH